MLRFIPEKRFLHSLEILIRSFSIPQARMLRIDSILVR
jgi:hypothetical protein